MKTVIFDCDGVLADFVLAFTKEIGAPVPWGTRENKSKWDFSDVFTKQQIDDAWSRIRNDKHWWTYVPALEDEYVFSDIDSLQYDYHVLFVTARVGLNPQMQTQRWLWDHGVDDAHVVVTDKKGEIARAVDASYHVDDKPQNAACVHWMSEKTKSYFVEHDYRRGGDWLPERIKRIKSVKEYIADIKEGK